MNHIPLAARRRYVGEIPRAGLSDLTPLVARGRAGFPVFPAGYNQTLKISIRAIMPTTDNSHQKVTLAYQCVWF